MEILSIVGAVLCIIGGLWLIVLAFQESILWGLACLFLPFVSILFVVTHWAEAKGAFLTSLAGAALIIVFGTPFGG